MARNTSRKIYLSYKGVVYKFVTYQLEDSDGSFYITLQREGHSYEYIRYSSNQKEPECCNLEKNREKRKKISYHSSGCVRYHNVHEPSAYFEPLSNITKLNLVASYIVPAVNRLDPFGGELTIEDFVIDIPDDKKKIQFTFSIAPWNAKIESTHIAIRYENLFCFLLEVSEPRTNLPNEIENHFVFLTPQKGLYEEQIIDCDCALVLFHQKLQNTRDLIIYSPNKEGIYKIICAVPMRIPPEVEIEFADRQYCFEIISKTKSVIKFKVKDKHDQTIKKEVPIVGITLDAEFGA